MHTNTHTQAYTHHTILHKVLKAIGIHNKHNSHWENTHPIKDKNSVIIMCFRLELWI